ncbi:MAG: sigma-54 dependent transcriptional regulator [Myxococcota bacterium]
MIHETTSCDSRIPRVLLTETNEQLTEALERWLRRRGYEVVHISSSKKALSRITREQFDLVLLDLGAPRREGWAALERLKGRQSVCAVVVLSDDDDAENAVRAMRMGAVGYVATSSSMDRILSRLDKTLNTATLRRSIHASVRDHSRPVIRSASMHRIYQLAARVARSPSAPVLILGESGAGKEVLATYIHSRSPRASQPFVRVNMAALPATTLEAELFGATRGAFTGARVDRPGLVASAGGGTLLLDELCEFDISLQAKLLRLVEQHSFFPVGSDRERHVDVRLLAATNVDPEVAMREGRLRPDLYYRLSTVTLRLPPLRERPEDIIPLARSFIKEQARLLSQPEPVLSPETEAVMLAYSWPGNIRQLRNAIERAMLVNDEAVVHPTDLGLHGDSTRCSPAAMPRFDVPDSELNLEKARKRTIEAVERECIHRALDEAEGAVTRAARILGISRSTLWTKLRRYGIDPSEAPSGEYDARPGDDDFRP